MKTFNQILIILILINTKLNITNNTIERFRFEKCFLKTDTGKLVQNDKTYLKIVIDTGSFIKIKYKINKKIDSLKFKYFNLNNESILPKYGVSIINEKKYSLNSYKLINQQYLFLPVLVNNNCMSLNIIDLKNKKIICNDLRTSLSIVWIKNKNNSIEFVVADVPKFNYLMTEFKYRIVKYKLYNEGLVSIKTTKKSIKKDIRDNIDQEFKFISNIW